MGSPNVNIRSQNIPMPGGCQELLLLFLGFNLTAGTRRRRESAPKLILALHNWRFLKTENLVRTQRLCASAVKLNLADCG
jgi:hypothetical protein